eukprot:7434351-Pyramimonas_sp.AAC.1
MPSCVFGLKGTLTNTYSGQPWRGGVLLGGRRRFARFKPPRVSDAASAITGRVDSWPSVTIWLNLIIHGWLALTDPHSWASIAMPEQLPSMPEGTQVQSS